MYSWNVMFNYLMNIKHEYNKLFDDFNSVSFRDVCEKIDPEFSQKIIITETDSPHGRLVLVKYNIYADLSDMRNNPNSIFREGRSLVINIDTDEIVLCPFRKFFNIDEIPETNMSNVIEKIQNSDLVEFSDKLDGSFQQFRWYKNSIVYSGSSALNANLSQQLREGVKIFKSDSNYTELCKNNRDYTFIFECILQSDPHIVNYNGDSLRLIGARNVFNGENLFYKDIINLAEQYKLPHTTMESTTLKKLISQKDKFQSNEKEGWVINVVNQNKSTFYKFKCDNYVNIHHVLEAISSHNVIIRALADGTYDDIISQVPIGYKQRVEDVANRLRYFVTIKSCIINFYFNKIKQYKNQKEFALAAKTTVPKDFVKYMFMKYHQQNIFLLKKQFKDQIQYIKMDEVENFIKQNEEFYKSLI